MPSGHWICDCHYLDSTYLLSMFHSVLSNIKSRCIADNLESGANVFCHAPDTSTEPR